MAAPRLDDLTARLVAWHNRHPLARRVHAHQVHSVGEVRLPFAAPGQVALLPPPPVSQRSGTTGGTTGSAPGTETPPADHTTSATDTTADAAAAAEDSAPAVDAASSDDGASAPAAPQDDDASGAEQAASANTAPTDADPPAQSAQDAHPEPETGHGPSTAPAPPPDAPGPEAPPAGLRAGPRHGGWLAGMRRRLGGAAAPGADASAAAAPKPSRPSPLRPLFSEDFIWPLSPRRVARWAQRHGQHGPVAPADWPHRVVETDAAMAATQRSKGFGQPVTLHVLAAGIGVGDRRLRVLIGADGAIIGPRSYSPRRLAGAGSLLSVALAAALFVAWPRGPGGDDAERQAALAPDAAASAASAASAAAEDHAAAASAPDTAEAAAEPEDDPAEPKTVAGHAPEAASTAAAQHADGPAEPPAAAAAHDSPASAPLAKAPASAAAPVTVLTSLPRPQAPAPLAPGETFASRRRIRLNLRPQLSEEERAEARALSSAARAGQVPLAAAPATAAATPPAAAAVPTGPVFALVTRPSAQRADSEAGLALMGAVRANAAAPVPERLEVLPLGDRQWRAAWWPFANVADAERARVMLASRGMKAEVVEF